MQDADVVEILIAAKPLIDGYKRSSPFTDTNLLSEAEKEALSLVYEVIRSISFRETLLKAARWDSNDLITLLGYIEIMKEYATAN
ncbi:MAG TPA: hypothetical protein VH186_27035 [Chloroflexia bacterium]|nr:hypothetical protein [Chloroflexia bacterium]